MKLRSILSEAYQNIVTGTTRAVLFTLFLAAISAGLAIVDARSIIDTKRAASEYVQAAASVRVLAAKKTTDAAACERLGTVPGIRAAGALKEVDAVVLRAMAANPIPAYAVTPGLIKLLGGDPAGAAGAWIPEKLATTLGVTVGRELVTAHGTMLVAGVYDFPDDGRDSRLIHAMLFPQPAMGMFDECWADIWPTSAGHDQLLYSTLQVDTSSSDTVNIGQLNNSYGKQFDGVGAFTARPTRHVSAACALVGLVLGLISIRMRRLEIATALHLGESRAALLLTLGVETAVWSLAALVTAACALSVGVLPGNPSDPGTVFAIDVRGPMAATPATLIGAVLALSTIRERHLFSYFKNR